MGVNGDSILPYFLQWVMIYSFGINTVLQIDHKLIPHTGLSIYFSYGNKLLQFIYILLQDYVFLFVLKFKMPKN